MDEQILFEYRTDYTCSFCISKISLIFRDEKEWDLLLQTLYSPKGQVIVLFFSFWAVATSLFVKAGGQLKSKYFIAV